MSAFIQFRFGSSAGLDTYEMTKRSRDSHDGKGPPLGSLIRATQHVTNTITGYTGCNKGTVLVVTLRRPQGVIARYREPHARHPRHPRTGVLELVILLHDEYERFSRFPSTGMFALDDNEGPEMPLGTARWLKPSKP